MTSTPERAAAPVSRPYKVEVIPEGSREGDVPYYARWSDGSEYRVWIGRNGVGWRAYHGPMFSRALGDWHTEQAPELDSWERKELLRDV